MEVIYGCNFFKLRVLAALSHTTCWACPSCNLCHLSARAHYHAIAKTPRSNSRAQRTWRDPHRHVARPHRRFSVDPGQHVPLNQAAIKHLLAILGVQPPNERNRIKKAIILFTALCCLAGCTSQAEARRKARQDRQELQANDAEVERLLQEQERTLNTVGSASTDASGHTTYQDEYGRTVGSASTDASGRTTYKDEYGRTVGSASTDAFGRTTYQDKNGATVGSKQ